MSVRILRGDCLVTMPTIAPKSVQTCVTSPPYYGLRDYGVDGQIGLEQTPEEYIAKMVQVFRLVRDALKDDGTLWLNLGDSYANPGNKRNGEGEVRALRSDKFHGGKAHLEQRRTTGDFEGYKPKDLLMIPARVALALQADGWYLRSEIIWHKPNPMPESVKDRPTKAHEMIYLLAKSQKYFYDAEAIKEPFADERMGNPGGGGNYVKQVAKTGFRNDGATLGSGKWNEDGKHTGRNRRDVWTVTTKPYKGAHFATFPPDLIEPCILAGTSAKGECPQCGKAWVRETEVIEKGGAAFDGSARAVAMGHTATGPTSRGAITPDKKVTLGWRPQCSCNTDPIPQTVLDPFNGSGTTGAVALKHGREYIGCELNEDYIKLTEERFAKVQVQL